ncbi:MAG TPA: hypothetical protein VNG31_00730 [Candidatus Baltobacteraceae bacterium]|nr:hypothetical protein [Candidatus Baltobacteraceae bacterium]
MHYLTTFDQNLMVAATALLVTTAYTILGIRNRLCDPPYALAFFVTAFVAFIIALSVLFQVVSSVIGYSMLCLALAGFQLAGLLQDEHARARQRRVALLAPRPAAEVVPTAWVALAVAAGLMLVPYVILDEQRVAAAIVMVCAFLMAGIAWRIASAPRQLFGEDVRYERKRDRYSRTRKTGVTAIVAMGSIMVFTAFVNYHLHTMLPLLRTLQNASWWMWTLSAVSLLLYCTYLGRKSSSAS